jgi:hypothetical protein
MLKKLRKNKYHFDSWTETVVTVANIYLEEMMILVTVLFSQKLL